MKRLGLFLACLAAGGVVVSPANAQRKMGFRFGQEQRDWRDIGADTPPNLALFWTARCLVTKHRNEVKLYLATVPGNFEEQLRYEPIGKDFWDCTPDMAFDGVGNMRSATGTMRFKFEHADLRGALAEALMRKEDIEIRSEKIALGDDGMYVAEKFHGARSSVPARAFALGFAGCVMGHNPDGIAKLLSTEPGGKQESEAVMEMAPSFSQCIMEGQKLSVTAPALRNQIAEVVYYAIGKPDDA